MRLALLLCVLGVLKTPASAQLRYWENTAGGLWSVPENWSQTDVPDTTSETAIFDRAADYSVTLTEGQLVSIDDLRIERGGLALQSGDFDDVTLSVAGSATVAGSLDLLYQVASVHVEVADGLSLDEGAKLSLDQATLTASSTSLAGGSLTEITEVELAGGTLADFGDLAIGVTGGGFNRVEFAASGGSSVMVDDFRLGADDPDVPAEVNLIGASLTQPRDRVTFLGQSTGPEEIGRGSLAVVDGGSAEFGSLVIRASGRLQNVDGDLHVADALVITDGFFSTRLDPDLDAPGLTVGGVAQLGGELSVDLSSSATSGFSQGDTFTVVQAGSITADFDTLAAPDLPGDLQWRSIRTSTTMTLAVVAPSIAGDFNYDGAVDAADYVVWRNTVGSTSPLAASDANGDGSVNTADLEAWKQAYGDTTAMAAAGVPEPATIAMLLVWLWQIVPVRSLPS